MKEVAEQAPEQERPARAEAPAQAGEVGEVAQILQLQRTVGNRATTRMLARKPPAASPVSLEDLAKGGDAAAIAKAPNLDEANHDQRIKMLEALAAVKKPTDKMRKAMTVLWAGLGAHMHTSHPLLYRACAKAGAKMPRFMPADDWLLLFQTRPGVLTKQQVSRMKPALDRLSVDDYLSFRVLLEWDGKDFTDTHRAFLWKALASGRTVKEIDKLWWDIWLRDEAWLMANLAVTDQQIAVGSTAKGIAQQWQMSCGPTTVQTLHAQTDPIYALSLRSAGDITVTGQTNAPLTKEQKDILKSQGSVATPIGTAGAGAWVESNLNALKKQTGVSYTFIRVIAKTAAQGGNQAKGAVDKAWTAITGFLDDGLMVPLLIGTSPGGNDHYNMALRHDGANILVNDPGNATTGWVSKTQVMNNNMSPPLSFPVLQGYDKPKK